MLRGPPRRDTVRCRLCGEEFVKRSFPFHLKSCARVHFVDLPAPHSGGVAVASAAPALDVVEWWREFVVASCNPAEDVPVGGGRGVGRGPSAEPSAAVAQHRRVGEDGDAAGATEPEGGKAATAPAHDRDHLVEPLVPCAYCGRTFFASRIQVHEDVCRVARERDSMRRTASVGLRGNRPGGTGAEQLPDTQKTSGCETAAFGRARKSRGKINTSATTRASRLHAAEWADTAKAAEGANTNTWWSSGNPVQTCYSTNRFLTQGAAVLSPAAPPGLSGVRGNAACGVAMPAKPPPAGEWSGVQSVAHSEVSARDLVAERAAALAVQNALDLLFVGAHVPVDSSAGEIGIPDPPAAAFSSRPGAEAAATSVSVPSASPHPEFHQSPGAELPGASSGVALTSEAAEQKDVHLLPERPQLHGTTVSKSVGRLLEPTKTVFCQQFLPHYHVLVGEVGRWRNTDRFFVVSEDRQRVTELELSREQLVLRPRTGELLLVHITRRKEDSASPVARQQEDSTGSSCPCHPNLNLSADGRFVLNFVRVYRECLCLDNYFGGRAQTAATSAAPLLGDQPTEAVEDYESHNRTDVPSCVSRALLVNPQKGSVCEVDRVLEARARRTSAVRAAPELQQPIFQVYIQVRRAGDRRWTPPVREPSLVFCELTKQTCLLCPGKGILKIDHGCVVLRRADDGKLLSPERNNYTTRSDSSYAPQKFRNKGPPFSFRPKARPQAEGCSPHTVLEAYENGNSPPSAAGRGHSAGRNYFVPEARPRGGSTSRGGESQPGAGAAVDVGSNAYYYVQPQEKMGGDIKGGSKSPAVAIKGAKKGAGKDGGKEAGGKQGSKSPLTPRGKEGEKGVKAGGKGEKSGKKSPVPAASKGGTAAGKKGPSPGSGDAIGSLVIDDAGGVVDGSLPLPLPGGGKSVKGSKAKGAVAKGGVAQSNSFLDGEGKKGAKAPPVIVNPPNKGGKGAGKSPPTPRDGSEAPPAQLGVGAKGGKDGGKSPTKGGKAAPETAGKGGKEKGKAPTDKGGLKGLSSAPTTLESAGNKDKGKSAAGKDGKGLPAAKGKGKKIGKSELVADTGSPIDAFEPAAGDGSKGAGKGKGKKGKARSVSPTTGFGAESAEAGVEEPLQPSGKKSGKLKGKGGDARSASPTIVSAAKGKGTKGDEAFDAAGKSGKGKAAAGKQQGKELKGNKGKTSAASPETTPRGAQKGEKKGLKKPGFATAATAPPLVLSEYDIQLPPPQFLKKGAKKGAEGGKKGPLADVGVPPADYVGASSSAAAGKKGGAAGKKGVKQTSGASATTADHSATEEVEVPAPGDELGAALLGTEGSDTAHLQDAAFGDASTRVTPRAEPPKGSIYEDVTLLDQAYETPALSEAEDTPAERQDQQMLALLRKLEQLGGAVSGTGAAVVAGASADEDEGADSAPRPEGTSGSAPSKTFQALDPRGARGWDDYVCVTLIQVLQIQPQEAVALLLKRSNTLPPGGAPRTYRTLLYDVVLEAEHPSSDMILQPMQSLSMGLRLWLCDLLKQDAELRTRLTEVDYQPFFLFFGQLLSTGCADLVLQLFIRILENADHGRREAAEIFRWLVGANGLHDLVVLLRSSPASAGGTNYNRSKPPFVAAVAVADGHAAQASQNPGLVNAYEDSELENENGRAPGAYSYSLGDSKVETDMLVEDVLSGREDEAGAGDPRPAQGTGAGGSSPSTAKRGGTHRQQQGGGRAGSTDAFFGGGRKLHAPLAAYEAALQKEIGAVILTYHDRTLSPMSVDDACARLLDKLRVSALDFPPTEDTYRAWSCLFFLVETFFEEQILRYTSAAYRTICCVFMERGMVFHNKRENESLAQKSDPIRAFALKHLIRFLEHPDVPVGVLAELLLKQLELTQSLSLADLDLLMALAGHGRLALGYASRMLEVLGQACFMNPYYARAATIPFLKLVARFANEDCIYSYVESLTKTGLGYILKEPAKWRNALIVDLLTRVGRMDERVSEAVKRPTVEAAITYLQTFKGVVLQQSLRTILEVWPEELRTLQDAFYNLNYEDEEELVAGAAGEGAAGAGEAHLQSAGAGGESEFKLKPDFLAVGVGLPN
eukprot:g3846.t1